MKYTVEILPINKKFDYLLDEINMISKFKFKNIKLNKIYSFSGDITEKELTFIIENLLLDPLIETYKFYDNNNLEKIKDTSSIVVNIWYKPSVLDVVANTISNAIKYLGIKKSIEIHSGTQLNLRPLSGKKYVKEILEKIFVNSLIQYYEII